METELLAKERILLAAEQLFAIKGFEQVTVREIAKQANCSHTSIYQYYHDKKELFSQLVQPPLAKLLQQIQLILASSSTTLQKLEQFALAYVEYGLTHRHLYLTIMTMEANRVDQPGTDWAISDLRLQLFHALEQAVTPLFQQSDEAKILSISRIIFYQLHGTIMTYANSKEEIGEIAKRVLPLVKSSLHYLIEGVKQNENNANLTSYL